MTDTHSNIYIKQLEIFLSKSDSERFQACEDLMIFGRKIIESAIIQDNNNLSDVDLKVEVFKRCYADQFPAEELKRIMDSMKDYLIKNSRT
jgi:hypothetical protein